MPFTTYNFLFIFFPFTIIAHFITAKKYQNRLLLLFSLFFLVYSGISILPYIFFSILTYYFGAIIIDLKSQEKIRKITLFIVVLVNVFILIIFKYPNYFVELVSSLFTATLDIKNMAMPIGISFYTFQGIAYISDVYSKKIEPERRFIEFSLFMTFFAQFTQGPILRYKPFENELDTRTVKLDNVYEGISRFIIGLWKKVFIANRFAWISATVLEVSSSNLTPGLAWIGAIAFSIQIYFDFSGYSDMAIGIANTFGFKFPENFNYPYIAISITDFWRRWHISLSLWFRDYIYIPLGGNRVKSVRYILNLVIVWLLTGIWHGATYNFVIWGVFNLIIILMEKFLYGKYLEKSPYVIKHIYTLIMIALSWTIFRTSDLSNALVHIKSMLFIGAPSLGVNDFMMYLYAFRVEWGLALLLCTPLIRNLTIKYNANKTFVLLKDVIIVILLFISIIMLVSGTFASFLYQAF